MLLEPSVDLFKPLPGRLLPSEQQNLIVSRIELCYRPVQFSKRVLLSLEVLLAFPYHSHADQNTDRNDQHDQPCHHWLDGKYHHKDQDERQDSADDLGKTLLQTVGYRVDIICHPA